MADITITIPTPVIITGQFFKVEYSTDGVSYTIFSTTETNTPFTITGLTAGTLYYFRFTLIQSASPLVECDPVIQTYFIPESQPCVEVEGEIVRNGDIYTLVLTFTLPSPYAAPCGGYKLEYGISPNFNTIYFPTFLTSPSINPMSLPAGPGTYTVNIYSIDCAGKEVLCDSIEVVAPSSCDHAVVTAADLIHNSSGYFLTFTITQSNPISPNYKLTYQQVNALSSGVNDPGGTIILTANGSPSQTFMVQVYPNLNVYNNIISYSGSILDLCKFSSPFDESLMLT